MARPLGKAERKYLERHAEPEAAHARELLRHMPRPFGHVVVIPAYGENASLLEAINSVPEGSRGAVLIIVVVNERDDAPAWATEANRDVLGRLRTGTRTRISQAIESLPHERGTLLLIDRTRAHQPLPDGQGVGLARKIGVDFALAIATLDALACPWLHCTDADVILPDDYFSRLDRFVTGRLPGDPAPSALLYDFEHRRDCDDATFEAALRYEIFLRYYRLGLASAHSRYAHHSIGSSMAISVPAYAAVRGFPKRLAAEDFHLLNKLAKVGSIASIEGAPILLSGRVSERVPFGTGAAIAQQLERARMGDDLPAYDPRVFAWLGVWNEALDALALDESPAKPSDATITPGARLQPDARSLLVAALEQRAACAPEGESRGKIEGGVEVEIDIEPERLLRLAEALGEVDALTRILRDTPPGPMRARRIHERFDALRTLKLIHAVRDAALPSLALEQAVARAPFLQPSVKQAASTPPTETTLERLVGLRRQLAERERELTPARA